MRLKTITYSLEIPMYHVAGMEVVDALSDVGELMTELCIGQLQQRDTHKPELIHIGVLLDVFQQVFARHPI